MKWLEKNWLIVAIVVGGYLWFNGSLKNLLGTGAVATPAATTTGGTVIYGG